ncbi:MAG: hypothetical protein NT040_11265 [Bacteroidetes bacterium]|nr:hypothetical protein [Bacteroidota bacterium]
MITINTTPPDTFFAGNPARFAISTDNMLSYIGRHCSFKLVVSAADTVAGHTLIFGFPGKTVTFTTAPVPDDSGLQIPLALSSANWSTWSQTLYDCLLSNYEISSRYIITIGETGPTNRVIDFMAYNRGAADSADVTSHLATVTKYMYFSGLDSINRPTFSIVGGIWDKGMKQLAQDIKPVDSNGQVTFNFSEYLSVLLENNAQPRFTWPFSPTELYHVYNNYILEFYAGFAERYENQIHKIHFDTMRNAFPGGLNRETIVAYNASGQQFFSVAENLLSFMTWAPTTKMTSKTCPELLFYYVIAKAPFDQLNFVVVVTFTDGTVDQILTDIRGIESNTVIELSVGYEKLSFETRFPTKKVAKWQVFLNNQDLHLTSESRYYILDNAFYEHERIFLFQNSYGRAYDVVRFTGKGSLDIEVDFSTASSDTVGDYTSFNAPSSKFAASELQKMKVNSGWISHETKDYLRELLLSKQVFEYKDRCLYPVIITNDKMKLYFKDDEYLYDIEIDYDRCYRDFFFQSS